MDKSTLTRAVEAALDNATELAKTHPELVCETPASPENNIFAHKGLDLKALHRMMLKQIADLQDRVATLEQQKSPE